MTVQNPFASLICRTMEKEKKNIIEEEIELAEGEKNLPDGERITGDFPWAKALLIAVIVVETALLVYTAVQRNMEGRELSSARTRLAATDEELSNSREAVEDLKAEIEKAKQRMSLVRADKSKLEIAVQEKDLEKLQLQLQQQELSQAKTDLEKKMRRERQISEYLRRKIVDSKKNELVLLKKVEDLVKSKEQFDEQIKLAEQEQQDFTLDVDSVPLKEVVVTDTEEARPPLTGTILVATYEVEPPFVIINIGSNDGVALGDRFTVKKGKKKVGSITVSKLYPLLAVAEIDMKTRKKIKKTWKVVSE